MALEDRSDRIDHDSPRLVWEQVADDIRADIEAGRLRPGARLPSGPELATQYGVAGMTIRRAIRALADDGLLIVRSGKGTYVAPRQG